MPTMAEIRNEWKTIRSALGNLICYIDGKAEQFGNAEETWKKGYDAGYKDGYKSGWSDCVDCEGQLPKEKTNAEKFLEVFPDVESISTLVSVLKNDRGNGFMRSKWWDEPYKEPEGSDEHNATVQSLRSAD